MTPRALSPAALRATAMRSLLRIRRAGSGGVRLRATAAATLTVAVALGMASAALLMVLQGSLQSSARAEAAAKAKSLAATVRSGTPAPAALPPPGRSGGSGPATAPGAPLLLPPGTGMGQPSATDAQVVSGSAGTPIWKTGPDYIVAKEQVDTQGRTVLIQGRSSLAPAQQAIASLRNLLVPGVPALLLLVALLTWIAVGRALKPVSAIRSKMADITAHDLHQRVPEPDSHDEIAELARTVNATLDRLQTTVEQHKRFVADAAHELRSPLAILRTRLELAGPDTPAPQLAAQALTDVARIQALTADLLLLARLDAGEPLRSEEIDLGQVVAEEAAQIRPRPDIEVRLDIASDVLIRGSGEQLKRLTANLVDNAVRHAATTVTVSLTAQGSHAVLEVTDDGPGIPAVHRDTVFDRFTRLDQARDRDHGGSGLGLPIARDIAHAHHGSLTVVPGRPAAGACLRTVLPIGGAP
ncbi:HAMP domain-containing sensor histidine kinase [Actinomadura scrupuli]|uniref:HAMP domain-containing sensor histidine kinase n=1 Tax=Actinomadura scrupuli TaxID=559629 RepID=UPI003D96F621